MAKPLRLWSCFWGDKHLDLFEKALVRSLSWPLNKAALHGASWDIWTKESDFAAAADIAKAVGINIELHAADSFIADMPTKYLNDMGVMINKMFCISAKRCLETDSAMLPAPPDIIFGGDSIANILQAGEQAGQVVFVDHMRVKPDILRALDRSHARVSLSNPGLVNLALEFPHRSFVEAEYGKERINSFVGGIFWKRRPNGIIAWNHRLPTPYLINWTQEDYDFFSRENPPDQWPQVFGQIDHEWPGLCVYPKGRARVLGSSDDAFICEVTDEESNVPPLMNYQKNEGDRFWRGAYHNHVNQMFCVTLRGE